MGCLSDAVKNVLETAFSSFYSETFRWKIMNILGIEPSEIETF
jgi:hypothetical protein